LPRIKFESGSEANFRNSKTQENKMMKNFRTLCASIMLVLAFSLPTFANDGWMGTGVMPTPTPAATVASSECLCETATLNDAKQQSYDLADEALDIARTLVANFLALD
jgi:hypothetical protein